MLTSLIVNKKYLLATGRAIKIPNMQPIASGIDILKKPNNICYSLTSNTEKKYKQRDAQRPRFCFYPLDLCRFSADFVVSVLNMVPEYGEPYFGKSRKNRTTTILSPLLSEQKGLFRRLRKNLGFRGTLSKREYQLLFKRE